MVSSFVDEKKPVPEAPWKSRKWCIAQKSGLTPSVDYLIWGVAAKQKKKKNKTKLEIQTLENVNFVT